MSCINSIFTKIKNFVTHSGVLPSLFSRCHHQLIFLKVSFPTFCPSAYGQIIWDFSRANFHAIRQAENCFDLDKAFSGLNIDERAKFSTECVLNVFCNFVPKKVITIRSKNSFGWLREWSLKKQESYAWSKNLKHGRSIADYQILCDITSRFKSSIKEAKSNCFSCLRESCNYSEKCRSILHRFLHKHKIPKISPIRHNNTVLTDTMVKGNTFNSFFYRAMFLNWDNQWAICGISTDLPLLAIC